MKKTRRNAVLCFGLTINIGLLDREEITNIKH